jgi:hypothetical protein
VADGWKGQAEAGGERRRQSGAAGTVTLLIVIPAKAGIQLFSFPFNLRAFAPSREIQSISRKGAKEGKSWIPAFAGMTVEMD